jgi:hypothetical protein
MRHWMVNPVILCRKHLMAENVEAHMFVSSIKKGISMAGYLRNNLLEPLSLVSRHDEIAVEMIKRGYRHESPVEDFDITDYIKDPIILNIKVDAISAFKDLVTRCSECRKRFLWYVTNGYAEITNDIEDTFTLQEWLVSNIDRYTFTHIEDEEDLALLTDNSDHQDKSNLNNYDKLFWSPRIYFDFLGDTGAISKEIEGSDVLSWEPLTSENYEFLKLKVC